MIAGTQKEAGAQVYDWCLSADRKQCRLVEAYVNQAAILAPLTGPVVQEFVPQLLEFADITRVEVYGHLGPKAGQKRGGPGRSDLRASLGDESLTQAATGVPMRYAIWGVGRVSQAGRAASGKGSTEGRRVR